MNKRQYRIDWWNMMKESVECEEEGMIQEGLNEEEMVQIGHLKIIKKKGYNRE